MSTHDYDIANADGATVRADINAVLEAIASNNSSSTAPPVTFPYMYWYDTSTTPAVLKRRNGANTGWVDVFSEAEVTTSTGTQTLTEALDQRVVHVATVSDMHALTGLTTGQLVDVQGSVFRWDGTQFVRWVDTSNEFVIYVDAANGNNSNDGLTSSTALLTLQAAIDYLATFGPYLRGQFVIELAAGTYARGRFPDDGLPSELPIIIRGPDVAGHPNVPTAIISEGANSVAADGILARGGTRITAKDLKFTGWDGSSSGGGLQGTDAGDIRTQNCHFQNCYWGVSVTNRSNLDVKGGIFTDCGTLNGALSNGAGTRTLFNSRHAIGTQNAGDLTKGPEFHGCAKACFAQEGATGHVDYATIHDCLRGLEARVNSRFNYTGTQFKRNTVDVFIDNAHTFASNSDHGTGADESNLRILANNYGVGNGNDYFSNYNVADSVGSKVYDINYVNTLYNSGTSQVFHTTTLKGGFWRNASFSLTPGRAIKFKVTGHLNGSNDVKRINLRMGSALAQLSFVASDSGVFEAEGVVYFTDRAEQFLALKGYRHLSPAIRLGSSVSSEALTSDTDIRLEAQVVNTSDSIRIYTVEATLCG